MLGKEGGKRTEEGCIGSKYKKMLRLDNAEWLLL